MISTKVFNIFSFSLCYLLSTSVGAIELPKVFRSGRGGEAKFIRDGRYWKEYKEDYIRKLNDNSVVLRNSKGEIEVLRPPSSNKSDLKIPVPDNYDIAQQSTFGYTTSAAMVNDLAWKQKLSIENDKIKLQTGSSSHAFTTHYWNENGKLTFGQIHTMGLDLTLYSADKNQVGINYQYIDHKNQWMNEDRKPITYKQQFMVNLPDGDHLTSYSINTEGNFTLIIKKSDGSIEKRVTNLHGKVITWRSELSGSIQSRPTIQSNGTDTDFGVSIQSAPQTK